MTTFQKVKLKDCVTFRTGKLNSNAAVHDGAYPFFTCSQEIYRTNTYAFDTECVLLGGNNASAVYPIFYYKGKFDAYQRTYIIEPKKENNIRFLYYLISKKLAELKEKSTGATTKFLTIKILHNIDVLLPDPKYQIRIASVLSAYDDLIENNEKRIKALEEMAQLLYTEWFVKFKFPGHEKVKMVESGTEYGKIPENFIIEDITKLIDFVRGVEPGSTNYKTYFSPGLLPFLRVGDLGSRSSELFVEKAVTKGKILERKDVAVTMDGTVGRVVIGFFGAYSTGIRKLVILDEKINREFLYNFMLSDYVQNMIKAHAKGSTILHASESINYIKIILPTQKLMDEFGQLTNPLIEQILNLQDQNRNLSQTRDLLIPQLVTGEREIKN